MFSTLGYDIIKTPIRFDRSLDCMTQTKKINANRELPVIILYFTLYCVIALSLLFRQPFGNPPDEVNRYLIPQYIAEHGTLPNGYDESIRIPDYGFSYAFQPILPYMAQGYVMRAVQCFTSDADTIFYAARLVDFVFGLIMAVFVLLLSRKWFKDKRLQYLFSFLVTFLPQSIFLHTYVNTDSCCMMSIAVMLYGLTCCLQNHFEYKSCLTMSIGIILCAMSYYNAYGFILSCILLFIAHYLSFCEGKLHLDWKPFLKKGVFISVLVLLGISWWFIRSYILYDGDFLGLRTRDLCGALYGNENMHPDVRVTYKIQNYTIPSMIFKSDFLVLSINSFICMVGPMIMATATWIYRFYKFLFLIGLLLSPLAIKFRNKEAGSAKRPALHAFFHINMVMCILIPCVLSITYSYSIDYQPQGRYIMPALIPLCFYCIMGIEQGVSLLQKLLITLHKEKPVGKWCQHLLTGLSISLIGFIVIALLVTVYGYAFPYYAGLS